MAKTILNEAFSWDASKHINRKNGQPFYKIYLKCSPETWELKDSMKPILDKYGFKYDSGKFDADKGSKYFVYANPSNYRNVIETVVKPCISELKSIEKDSTNSVEDDINKIILAIDNNISAIEANPTSIENPDEIKKKLSDFKQELIRSFQDGSFKEKMGPLIKFRKAQGNSFSLLNTILIKMQKPDAIMVKSAKNWALANRTIKKGEEGLYAWVPVGKRSYTQEELKKARKELLERLAKKPIYQGKGKLTYDSLTVGDKERYRALSNAVVPSSFELHPRFFDYSQTEQMEGKEDLVGDPSASEDLQWYDPSEEETSKTIELYDAAVEAIKSFGIRFSTKREEDMGGARGWSSTSGEIVGIDGPKSIDSVSTLIHELSHALLHQGYVKSKNSEYAQYFVGREGGKYLIEQQAEISAWIVMRNFGYDRPTAINYAGSFGADEDSAGYVFDSVAKVSEFIIKTLNSILNKGEIVKESMAQPTPHITGLDVAKMLGPDAVKVYIKAKKKEVNNGFFDTLDRMDAAKNGSPSYYGDEDVDGQDDKIVS